MIERVLTSGFLSDWQEIVRYYGYERIKNEALEIRYLDSLTLNFCSTFFPLPKQAFKGYKQTQSIPQHWTY